MFTRQEAESRQLATSLSAPQRRLWLVAALTVVLGMALPNLTYPIGRDQATFCVIGRGLLHGQQLYRDLWDMKPPAIFYAYAMIVKIFGPVMWSVGLVDILWLLAISYCIFLFADRFLGALAGFLAVTINAAWHCRADYVNAAQPETFLMLFVFAAYFAADGGGRLSLARQFAAGLLLGVAFWFKYNALPFVPLVLLAPYLDKSRPDTSPPRPGLVVTWRQGGRNAVALLAGFAATVGGVMFCFWHAGLWEAFTQSHLQVALRYAALPYERLHHDFWIFLVVNTIKRLGPWAVAGTFTAFLVAWKKRELAGLALIFLAALAGYLSAAMQAHLPFYAFETCYPFCAMLWAYLIMTAYEALKRVTWKVPEQRRRFYAVSVLAALAVIVAFEVNSVAHRYRELGDWWRDPDSFYANYSRQFNIEHLGGQIQVIRYIKENSQSGDCIYVWGAYPLPYYLTGSCVPTRFVPNFPLMSSWGPPAWRQELIRDLERFQPPFIVVARNDDLRSVTLTPLDSEKYLTLFPQLGAYIAHFYNPVKTIPDFVIYRRTPFPEAGKFSR